MTRIQGPCVAVAVLLSATTPSVGFAQAPADSGNRRLIEALREFIPEVMRQDGTPGLNIALARGGKIVWQEGFGYADVARK
ncbi:MAG TPA: hypothetical protein VGA78_12505, partial [Gemmatimonadales bacterium]